MNNDRFKFRVAIPVEYGGENADGISTTLIIHNAVPHSNGNVCVFGIDELDAALERAGINDERDICQIHEYMYANFLRPASHDYFMADFMADIDCLDQCTGVKDKNGNLIYESDIIHDLGEIEPVCNLGLYKNVIEASLHTAIHKQSIYNCLHKKQKTAGGYKWIKGVEYESVAFGS